MNDHPDSKNEQSSGLTRRTLLTGAGGLATAGAAAAATGAFAAEPKSKILGRPDRVSRAYRSPLLNAQYPMWVLVAYRMLLVSNSRRAPRSESSSCCRTLESR